MSSFRTKLLLLVLVPVLPALALILHSNFQLRRTERARVTEKIASMARLVAAREEFFIKNSRQQLATLSQFSFLVLATNAPFCQVHFANLLKLSPDYINFGLIETNGRVFACSLTSFKDVDLSDRAYFRRTLETGRFAIGEFQTGRITGEQSLNFGHPIFDERHELRRVLFSSLKLPLLTEAAVAIGLPEGATVTVLDRNGTVLARTPETSNWVGRSFASERFVQEVLRTRDGTVEADGLDGVRRVYAVTSISDGQAPSLYAAVGVPTRVLFRQADRALWRTLLTMAAVITLALLASRSLAQREFIRPIQVLAGAADRLASGDLRTRARISNGAQELRALGNTFDTMASSLEKREGELKQAQDAIQAMNVELEAKVQQRTAELQAANRELEAFSYSVSHDLRAPLRHVDGFVELLQKRAGPVLDDKSQRYLRVISDSTREMAALIDSLLAFSRMARAELRKTRVDLAALVPEVIQDLEVDAAGRNIAWKLGTLPEVEADPHLMRQALVNLLSNALKYTRNRPQAEIAIDSLPANNGHVGIVVADNGVGFDMQYADKLFGVFQRLHNSEQFEGTGIGLANVHRIITRHGGQIWAEAVVDAGAKFYFTLPKPNSAA